MPSKIVKAAIRLPLALIPKNATVPILRGHLRGKSWIAGSSNHSCWLGGYESDWQNLIIRTVPNGSIFFDIGANVGFYTLLASSLVGDSGKVVAFEPVPSNINKIKKHLEINSLKNVTVYEAAISDYSGEAQFQKSKSNSQGKFKEFNPDAVLGDDELLTVKVLSLDELLAKNRIPNPDYLKIDIEGAEFSALLGAKKYLADFGPTIFLSTHGNKARSNCLPMLNELGYTCHRVSKEKEILWCEDYLATSTMTAETVAG